ncbi:bifunctional diguanylate cyclase/phosphodiesterase [Methylobacterium terrae]|uniref:Bifunctional diguanylate cyclase/phosphodiesterase n=1 Tax=Methylobacterium terrae TaxID=2202827 RepID=A0A2U8WR73_9HYPH|nr:EAL domain-containing protein [Methylobacterium terrae]AWN48597.1 bifunctional diguanylate cyclase/phosphodiesterase [Methylobacterium terrae]
MSQSRNDERRVAALDRTGLLSARSDETFLSLVGVAADAFGAPIATISLIDAERQFYFEKVGITVASSERCTSFCTRTIEGDGIAVILDAAQDPHWCDNPMVTGAPYIRFYAGVPLRIDGHAIGTFCLIDTAPRAGFSEGECRRLERYAAIALEMLELRARHANRDSARMRFRHMAETSPDAMIVYDAEGGILHWNGSAERLFGHDAAAALRLGVADLTAGQDDRAPWFDDAPGAIREAEIRLRDGSARAVEVALSRWSEGGETIRGAVLRDTSQRREREAALHALAHRDALTGLANRALMRLRLEAMLAAGPVAVLLVDLDGFKDVNDTVGHAAGDEVLKEAAARLLACLRDSDVVARIGGDEFVVALPGCGDPSAGGDVADRIVAAMAEPFPVQERSVRIGASVGLALAPAQAESIDELLFCADLAVYKAKADGRHRHRLYTPSLRAAVSDRQRFVHEFPRALAQEEFVLHYQPQIRLRDGALVGAEALIRWRHPEHGLLEPPAFLPALLASRHAVAVNDWVLRTACRQAAAWLPRAGPHFRMGVNACATRLHSGEIAGVATAILAETGLAPGSLELEITEAVVLAHEAATTAALHALRARGIGIAFDDFGTGYASLSLLDEVPVTRLKIDRSFVRKMNDTPDVPVIRAILQLAEGFGLDVVAEGIETEDQLRRLRRKGCAEGQGYLFSPPVEPEAFAARFLPETVPAP